MKGTHMLAIGLLVIIVVAVVLSEGEGVARAVRQRSISPQDAGDDKNEPKAGVEFILPPSPQDAVGVMQLATLSYVEGQPDRPVGVSLPRLQIKNAGQGVAIQPALRFADTVSGLATEAHVVLPDTLPNMEAGQPGVAGGCYLHLAPPDSPGMDLLKDIASQGADCALEISWKPHTASHRGRTVLYGKRRAQRTPYRQDVLLAQAAQSRYW